MSNNKDTQAPVASGESAGILPSSGAKEAKIKKEPSEQDTKSGSDSEANANPSPSDIISCRNGNFKIEDLLPDSGEELLGSVTFAPIRSSSSANPGPVRSSARVIQKMRQDNRPSTPPTAVAPTVTEAKGASHAPKTPTQTKLTKKLWSNTERNLFFEALNEFGKDFDAIAQHINQKMRRQKVGGQESTPCKSREHIRQMYLQSFHKASKYLRFSEDVKKVAQELYALINYGEMRRKLPFMHEKASMKLKELVYRGTVTIREKGKTIRIKTPSCRALKKLNQLEEWQEEVTLPQRIEINLVPATMESWGRVQSLAQNPRIKTSLPLHKRVSSLLTFLQSKWRSQEMRLCQKSMTFQPVVSGRSRNSQKNSNLAQLSSLDNQELLDQIKSNEPLLCFAPPPKTIIHRPMVNLTGFSNSYSICLNSFEERIGAKCRGEDLPVEKILTHKEKMMNGKRLRLDSGGEGKKGSNSANAADKKVKSADSGQSDCETKTEVDNAANASAAPPAMETTQTDEALASRLDIRMFDFSVIEDADEMADRIDLFSDNSEDKKLQFKSDTESVEPEVVVAPKANPAKRSRAENRNTKATSFKPLISEDVIRKIREGWTLQNCGDLTFGDLYVMFGNEFKITLEYKWNEKEVSETAPAGPQEIVQANKTPSANEAKDSIPPILTVDKAVEQLVGRRLAQLIMVANLMDKNRKKDCTCDSGGRMKENDYPYPDSNLFKHPALPLRYSHYNGHNSLMHMRRLKPRQIHPFMSPKPYHHGAANYYHSGRVTYPRPQYDEAMEGDAEGDGEEGTSRSGNPKVVEPESPVQETNQPEPQPPADIIVAECAATEVTSTTEDPTINMQKSSDGDDEDDFLKNPGFLSLLEITLPSMRSSEESRSEVVNRTGWLEDNINDYSFSSLLGHLDAHLANGPTRDNEINGNVDSSPSKRIAGSSGASSLRNEMSDRCSVISETSVDFVNKFAELAEMIQDH